jgi:hypothetical protein
MRRVVYLLVACVSTAVLVAASTFGANHGHNTAQGQIVDARSWRFERSFLVGSCRNGYLPPQRCAVVGRIDFVLTAALPGDKLSLTQSFSSRDGIRFRIEPVVVCHIERIFDTDCAGATDPEYMDGFSAEADLRASFQDAEAGVRKFVESGLWPTSRTTAGTATLPIMVERPTAGWHEQIAEEAAGIAAGTLDPDDAFASGLFPAEMLAQTDEVLNRFEEDVADLVSHRWEPATDADVFAVIERTVKALNVVNARFDGAAYETGERGQLCEYIEAILENAGIDVDAFAGRHRMTRHEITDEWREW